MANITLDLNINSARNLSNVNLFTKMNVYAVITLNGDKTQNDKQVRTPVDRPGGSHPKWNHAVNFSVDEALVRDGRLTLNMKLFSRCRVLGNKSVGAVNVPLTELLNSVTPSTNGDSNGQEMRFVKYRLRSLSGNPKGSFIFSYRFNMPPVQPNFQEIMNQNSVIANQGGSFGPPPPNIEHSSSVLPEPEIQLYEASCQNDSDHRKHLFTTGDSSSVPLPISYCHVLPPIHNRNGPYGRAPPSPARFHEPVGLGLGLGLEVGLLNGFMIGEIACDIVNAFDI